MHYCNYCLVENWTSLDVTSSVVDTQCASCFGDESSCPHDRWAIDWDQSSSALLPRRHGSHGDAGRRSRTGRSLSLLPRTLLSAEVRSTLASLRCSTRAVYVSRLAVADAARLTTVASGLETEMLRFAERIQSTKSDLRHRVAELRRRLRFHSVTVLHAASAGSQCELGRLTSLVL